MHAAECLAGPLVQLAVVLRTKWRAFLNNGSLGVVSKPVFADIVDYLQRSAELNVDHYPRWGYETLDEEREEMAAFLGCHKDELAFTHNCTEAMNIVANGLDLKEGDEVLLTDQEHTGGTACWEMKAARFGIKVRKVPIPVAPQDPAEISERLISAIRPRTRVVSFSGITTKTGLILPVRQICKAARAKGVITVVDGAHMNGQIPVDLHDLGCDYFAGSPHKWMFAPAGCGILYGRPEMLDRLWPSIVSGGWNNKEQLKAARFMRIGTNNRAIIHGMMAGLRFLKSLGPENVYRRMGALSRLIIRHAKNRSYLELVSSADPRMYNALVTIRFKTETPERFPRTLQEKNFWVLGGRQMRLSSHVHTRPRDIEEFFEIADDVLAR